MGTATYTYGGKGFKERTRVSGERPIGAASLRQHPTRASCQPPPGRIVVEICGNSRTGEGL